MLIIQDERLNPEATDVLEGVDHAVVLDGEGIENAIKRIDALEL